MLRILIISALLLLHVSNVFAEVEYDREENVVELSTPILANDHGWITIYNEQHIRVRLSGFDENANKMIGMCGKDLSLGLLFLEGEFKLGRKVPNVTEVEKWPDTEENKNTSKAGWVRSFILKGDDALDLMGLLYEYQAVGFAMLAEGCAETEYVKPGKITLNFETRGLERAMKRIK